MYKTVKKGDASLQYTILPQTDQFFGNNQPPQPRQTDKCPVFNLPVIIALIMIFIFGLLAIIVIQYPHRDYFVGMSVSEINHKASLKHNDTSENNYSHESIIGNPLIGIDEALPTPPDEILNPRLLDEVSSTTIHQGTQANNLLVNSNPEGITLTSTSATTDSPPTVQSNEKEIEISEASILLSSSPSALNHIFTSSESTFSTSENIKDTSRLTINNNVDSTTTLKSSTSTTLKKIKMPRVTLKLRENETIPQMYMKAGIASYKKGNITTSVLAHGLSLEGLIFKTPEGTIKPWNEKWPFSNSSPYAQWKRDERMRVQVFTVLVGLMASFVFIFCVLTVAQLLGARRRSKNVEEPPLLDKEEEEQDDDTSKLLEIEYKDSDKE